VRKVTDAQPLWWHALQDVQNGLLVGRQSAISKNENRRMERFLRGKVLLTDKSLTSIFYQVISHFGNRLLRARFKHTLKTLCRYLKLEPSIARLFSHFFNSTGTVSPVTWSNRNFAPADGEAWLGAGGGINITRLTSYLFYRTLCTGIWITLNWTLYT